MNVRAVRLNNLTFALINQDDGSKIALYHILPFSSEKINMELTVELTRAYDRYYRSYLKIMKDQH